MTDEAKLAIEIVNNLDTEIYDCEGSCVSIYDHMESACLAGIKAGKPKWHDLRKDKTDRPIKDCDVALKVYNYRNKEILRDIGFYKMKEDMFYHYKSACKILAWTELPKFEEKE